jgi:glutamyl-tRNA synthetase
MELKDIILKHALANAIKFNGKASAGSVISATIAEKPEEKANIKDVARLTNEIVKDVNSWGVEKQTQKLQAIAPEMLEKKEAKKRELPELKNAVMGKVVTRIPPEPSKYLHVGHALSFLINYLYAKKYNGKCVLRFEDTNPEKSAQEFVEADLEDLKFLGIEHEEPRFFSDDMEKFYGYAEKLIDDGKAYVCSCEQESMKELRHNGEECSHRSHDLKTNMQLWNDMKSGKAKEGSSILRLKIDMQAENQVLRDPVIFRIVETEHYRQGTKYKAWPMYDFAGAVEEELCGVTHILRSSEFGTMRVELQDWIKEQLGFENQEVRQYGRFGVQGTTTQGRELRELVESGKVTGWDDPRLVTIKSLRRRGFVKETFYELAIEVGLSPSATNVDWSHIEAINRRFIDESADRYFFIAEPIEIRIDGAESREVELDLYPEKRKGGRVFRTGEEFFIEKSDFDRLKDGSIYRLMDCLNFTIKSGKPQFHSQKYIDYRDKGSMIMHWLPKDATIDIEVLMNDGSIKRGFGEESLKGLKEGSMIQFTRFGFCRLDRKDGILKFVFTHK